MDDSMGMKRPNAAQISRVLREAGFPKASPYSTWGRVQDGFEVKTSNVAYSPIVQVWDTTDPRGAGRAPDYSAALRAAGYNAFLTGRDGRTVEVCSPGQTPESERARASERVEARKQQWISQRRVAGRSR